MAGKCRKKATENGDQLIESFGCMATLLHAVRVEKLLKLASISCILSGVLIPWAVDARPLSIWFFSGSLFFVAGMGLITRQKWARYLAIVISVIIGAGLFYDLLFVLNYLFNSPDPELSFRYLRVTMAFAIGAFPGYILLRSDVKKLFPKRENVKSS
jgi:hypothetical protein